MFGIFWLVELVYCRTRGKSYMDNQADMISSFSSGIASITIATLGLTVVLIGYDTVVGWFSAPEVDVTSPWPWIAGFVALDFAQYWTHRWAHERNALWGAHLIHHSSEEYNLAVALRQTAFPISYGAIFLVPLAMLGIPAALVGGMAGIHLIAQYWYHTQTIGKLGWLEFVLVTPSQHRVHHAMNPTYVDRNYGAIFCVWDRWFGTFQEERDEEPVVFGLTRPVQSWNPIAIDLSHWRLLILDTWRASSWRDRARIWLGRTGVRPPDVEVAHPVAKVTDVTALEKFHPPASDRGRVWAWVQLLVMVVASVHLLVALGELTTWPRVGLVAWIVTGLVSNTRALAGRSTVALEAIRAVATAGAVAWLSGWPASGAFAAPVGALAITFCTFALGRAVWRETLSAPQPAPY